MRILSGFIGFLLNRLDEPQLRLVHADIVERLHSLHHARERTHLAQFQIGDAVSFVYREERHVGCVCHKNRRMVSVRETGGKHWNVSPGYLTKIAAPEPPDAISE